MASYVDDWIYQSPIVIVLLINSLFLVKIMWVSRTCTGFILAFFAKTLFLSSTVIYYILSTHALIAGADYENKVHKLCGNAPLQKSDQSAFGSDTAVGHHVLSGHDKSQFHRTPGEHLQVQQSHNHQHAGILYILHIDR